MTLGTPRVLGRLTVILNPQLCNQRAFWMIALTSDLDVLAPGVTTRLTANIFLRLQLRKDTVCARISYFSCPSWQILRLNTVPICQLSEQAGRSAVPRLNVLPYRKRMLTAGLRWEVLKHLVHFTIQLFSVLVRTVR